MVKPLHSFWAEERSLTRKMNQLQIGGFANKEEKLRTTIDVLVCYKLGRVIMGPSKIDQYVRTPSPPKELVFQFFVLSPFTEKFINRGFSADC